MIILLSVMSCKNISQRCYPINVSETHSLDVLCGALIIVIAVVTLVGRLA